MPHDLTIKLDGFTYDLQQKTLPTNDGGEVQVRTLMVGDQGTLVELIFSEDDWETFMRRVAASKLVVTSIIPANHYGRG